MWPAGALLLAITGLADDRRGLSQGVRLAAQALAVAAALIAIVVAGLPAGLPIDGMPGPTGGLSPPGHGWPAAVVVLAGPAIVLAGLWWINLFNFMDGIDGIAACQAIYMLLAGLLIRDLAAAAEPATAAGIAQLGRAAASDAALLDRAVAAAAPVLAAAVAGFLVLNWPPARVFMGDSGSLFLGFAIFTMALHDVTRGHTPLWAWLILSGTFLVDASVTLACRLLGGENVRRAHRSHAYQRLGRRLGSHAPVTLVYCLVNVCWLLPIAVAAARWPSAGPGLAVVALLPLAAAARAIGAGSPERRAP